MSHHIAIIWRSSQAKAQIDEASRQALESYTIDWFASVYDFLSNNDPNIFYNRILINSLHVSGLRPNDPKIANPNPTKGQINDPRVDALLKYKEYLDDGRSGVEGATETIFFTNTTNPAPLFDVFEDIFGSSENGSSTPACSPNLNLEFVKNLITNDRDSVYATNWLPYSKEVKPATQGTADQDEGSEGSEGASAEKPAKKKKKQKRGLFGRKRVVEDTPEEVEEATALDIDSLPVANVNILDEEEEPAPVEDSDDTPYALNPHELFQGESETGVYDEEDYGYEDIDESGYEESNDSEVVGGFAEVDEQGTEDFGDSEEGHDQGTADINAPFDYVYTDRGVSSDELVYLDFEDEYNLYWDLEKGKWFTTEGYEITATLTFDDGSSYLLSDLTYNPDTNEFLLEEFGFVYDRYGNFLRDEDEAESEGSEEVEEPVEVGKEEPVEVGEEEPVEVGEEEPVEVGKEEPVEVGEEEPVEVGEEEPVEVVGVGSEEYTESDDDTSADDDSTDDDLPADDSTDDDDEDTSDYYDHSGFEFDVPSFAGSADVSSYLDYSDDDDEEPTTAQPTFAPIVIESDSTGSLEDITLAPINTVLGTASDGFALAVKESNNGKSVVLVNLDTINLSFTKGLPGHFLMGNHTLEGTAFQVNSNLAVYSSTLRYTMSVDNLSEVLRNLQNTYDYVIIVPGSHGVSKGKLVVRVEPTELSVVEFLYKVGGKSPSTVEVIKQGTASEYQEVVDKVSANYVPAGYNWLSKLR